MNTIHIQEPVPDQFGRFFMCELVQDTDTPSLFMTNQCDDRPGYHEFYLVAEWAPSIRLGTSEQWSLDEARDIANGIDACTRSREINGANVGRAFGELVDSGKFSVRALAVAFGISNGLAPTAPRPRMAYLASNL